MYQAQFYYCCCSCFYLYFSFFWQMIWINVCHQSPNYLFAIILHQLEINQANCYFKIPTKTMVPLFSTGDNRKRHNIFHEIKEKWLNCANDCACKVVQLMHNSLKKLEGVWGQHEKPRSFDTNSLSDTKTYHSI